MKIFRVLCSLLVIQFCFGMEDKLTLIEDTIFDENKFVIFDEDHPEMGLIQYLSKEDENIFEQRKKLSPAIFNSIKEKSLISLKKKTIESFIHTEAKKEKILYEEIQALERRLEQQEEESVLIKKAIKQLEITEKRLNEKEQKEKRILQAILENKRKKKKKRH